MVILGLYISKESFFIAEVCLSEQKPKILYLEETFWFNLESEEEKMALLAKKIQDREEVYKGQNIRICCSLPQNFVSSFSLQLPFKERFKILKTIPFEVEDHTPFQANQVLFDMRVCQIQEKNKTHILSFVTPEESVQDFLQIVQGLNRPIHLLSCSVACLANLLETWNRPLSKPQNPDGSIDTYLYLGIENSYLFFYKKGFLHSISVLDWGCGGIIDEMQSTYKLSREKAWEEFFNKAFLLNQVKGFTKEQVFFSNLVKKHTEPFVPKFNLLKMSLEAKKEIKVSKMMLFGPGAKIKNLSSFLSEELDLSVYKSKYLAAFPHWDWRVKPSGLIAVGLTLEALKRYPYPGLNFLSFQKKAPALISLGSLKNRVFMLLVAFFVLLSYSLLKKYETDQVVDQVETTFKEYGLKIAQLPTNKIEVQAVEAFLKTENKKQVAEKQIQEELSQSSPIKALEKIAINLGSSKPWDLSLEFIKISGLHVEMRGSLKAEQFKSFQSVIQNLASTRLGETKKRGLQKEGSVGEDNKRLQKLGKEQSLEEAQEEEGFKKGDKITESGRVDFSFSFKLKNDDLA